MTHPPICNAFQPILSAPGSNHPLVVTQLSAFPPPCFAALPTPSPSPPPRLPHLLASHGPVAGSRVRLRYKGRTLYMTREEGDLLTVGRHKRPMQMEALRLSVWGRDLAIIEDLMATALATRLEARHEGLGVYILDTDDWPSRCVHGYGTGTDTAMPGAGKTAFGVTLLSHLKLGAPR